MTPAHKRIAKYYLILRGIELNTKIFEPNYSPFEIRAIECAIAEVEEIINELIHYDDTGRRIERLYEELTQLKEMI
jgi:hypothetical protein